LAFRRCTVRGKNDFQTPHKERRNNPARLMYSIPATVSRPSHHGTKQTLKRIERARRRSKNPNPCLVHVVQACINKAINAIVRQTINNANNKALV